MKRRAITLIEVVVVVAIILVLAATVTPVLRRAVVRSQETTCANNLKQIWYAVSLYRQEWDGVDHPDHPHRMALPPYRYFGSEMMAKPGLICKSEPYQAGMPNFYMVFWGNDELPRFEEYVEKAWMPFAQRYQSDLILIGDPQHQHEPKSPFSRQRFLTISLAGQYKVRHCIGNPLDIGNWMK